MTDGARALIDHLRGDAEVAEFLSAEAEIAGILAFERALASAQASLGLVPDEAAAAIASAIDGLGPAWQAEAIGRGLRRDGVPVPALVKALRSAVGEPHGAHVHAGATSQDAVDTGLMLRLKPLLAVFLARIDRLLEALRDLSQRQGALPLMAQTRMQAALPFTVADKIATWSRPLAGHRGRLGGLAAALPLQFGGPIGNGEGLGPSYETLRAALADRLALRDAPPWHSDRTVILDVAQGLSLLSGTLGKIGQDVALLAQSDRAAIRLAGGGASSAMAHKQNPVGAEVLVALARFNAGMMGTLAQSMVHENERSGAAWTLEWMVLPQMAETTGAALGLARELLDGARFAEG